jgi:hypothetical protein
MMMMMMMTIDWCLSKRVRLGCCTAVTAWCMPS